MSLKKKLNVYLNHLLIGELGEDKKNSFYFQYHPQWLKNEKAFSFSLPLPLREEPYTGAPVYAYFDNLLPDNISIRRKIALQTLAASAEVFDLLAKIGRDCVGALQFLAPEEPPPLPHKVQGEPQSEKQILETVRDLEYFPLGIKDHQDLRLSLAGMQEKTAYLFYQNQWMRPLGTTPTTHIFKPTMRPEKMQIPLTHSVENEWLCSQILKAFDLPVAATEILEIESEKILVVERFDRQWRPGNILIRVPQEDLCQALQVASDHKYESDGGPGIQKIMDLLSGSQNRETDRKNFMKSQILFWALSAIDGHAKNFSLFHSPVGFQLTPLYDVLSASPAVRQGQISDHDLKVAMAVGEKRHYKVLEIFRRHWEQTAKLCKFPSKDLEELIHEIQTSKDRVISEVQKQLPADFPAVVADSILEDLRKRIELLEL